MNRSELSVKELESSVIPSIVNYWVSADEDYLHSMGVDVDKVPSADKLEEALKNQLELPLEKKNSLCIIWYVDHQPIGHCNTNPTKFSDHAYMHLHIWDPSNRKKGYGLPLLKKTIPIFFEKLRLKKLYSEPYALNKAPGVLLSKVGFELEKEYVTVPGAICFEQNVKRWRLNFSDFRKEEV